MKKLLAWYLVEQSDHMFKRPRGKWIAFEMQMIAHGLLGNGWSGILMQLRRDNDTP